jgi:hypothetical protein
MISARWVAAWAIPVLALTGPLATCEIIVGPRQAEQRTAQMQALLSAGATPFQAGCIIRGKTNGAKLEDRDCVDALRK